MQRLTLFMIFAVTTFPYFSNGDRWGRAKFLPSSAAFVPELLGALGLVVVIALGTRDRFRCVRPAYWIAFGALLLIMVCGVIVNQVDSGPMIAGARLYLRALPWFFVPAVFAFSERQIRSQLYLLMGICLAQVPIAIEQRIKTGDAEMGFVAITGDWTTGTMGDSGILSIFLIVAACIAAALYEKRQLRFSIFLALFLLMLLPTTINETKATIVFLPIGLLVAVMCAAEPSARVKRLIVGASLLLLFGAIFVPVYDRMNEGRPYAGTLKSFFLDKDKLENYVSAGTPGNTRESVGRADAIAVPLSRLADDPAKLAFGFGIGNASDSSLGAGFSGRYALEYRMYLQSALARYLLELGVLGVALLLAIYWLIFQDCRRLARTGSTLVAGIAAGWAGALALMTLATLYDLLEAYPPIAFLFWYFSGLVAAERMRMMDRNYQTQGEGRLSPASSIPALTRQGSAATGGEHVGRRKLLKP